MTIAYLDGRRFRRVVIAGAEWVRRTREDINRINVFPVADSDTGTNMALTLSATASALRDSRETELGAAARQAAEAAVMGAKGNSGLILAHWFLGLSEAFGSRRRIPADAVPDSLHVATRTVYGALEEPVEGTIITVMQAVSECACTPGEHRSDLARLLERMIESGHAALDHTREQLAVLRDARVVDAGAQGFVNFLDGARRAVRGEAIDTAAPMVAGHDFSHDVPHSEEAISERFCTEVVVRGKRFAADALRRRFHGHGSSLLVAATPTLFKLHIHTNEPDEILRMAARLGVIEERKVDDMLRQRDERGADAIQPLRPLAEQPATVAVLCDSTADLPVEVRREHGIEMAPLQVLFGDAVFRDQVDLDTDGFYQRLQSDSHHPTTSQPPPREFVDAMDRIRSDREVVVVTISSALSGTHRSAQSAAKLAPHPRIEVFDSGSASLGLGMMTLNAARLAETGADADTILRWLQRWREDSGLVISLETLDYLRRGGRIGAASALVGGLLGLRPILTFEDGNIRPLGRGRGADDALRKVVRELETRVPDGCRVRLGLVEIGSSRSLDTVAEQLAGRCEVVEVIRGAVTGVIGAHVGPGAWGLFYQRVRDDDPLAPATR